VFQTTGKHTAGFRVFGFAAGFRCSRRGQAHSGFSGFQQSSGFADFILESANRDSDLDTLDKEASRGAIMPEKSGSTESEWWEEKTGQAEGCHG
jgi:hypothetical protein